MLPHLNQQLAVSNPNLTKFFQVYFHAINFLSKPKLDIPWKLINYSTRSSPTQWSLVPQATYFQNEIGTSLALDSRSQT